MIQVDALSIQAGNFRLSNISFEVPDGTYGILMGRTGSGKTTILEAICGLKKVVSGRIILKGRDVTHLKPAERGIGFVPQDGGLFPTMTVRQQLGFALKVRKWSRTQIAARVSELAKLLGIGHLLERSLFGLSGGERQRIALGRALAAHPDVLCLDEPLSALDEATREEMYDLLKSVQKSTGVTALHITHSISEATRLGDNAFVLEDGGIIGGAAFAEGKSGRSLHDPPAMSVKKPNRDPLPPSGENSSVQKKETAANDRG
ncbi:MAG: ATP-binding cassette domain-containing protein [Planctomycetes bacterium]|nr:ATP-binding cassette domain-containing protein [Planctomycetota bacterium]